MQNIESSACHIVLCNYLPSTLFTNCNIVSFIFETSAIVLLALIFWTYSCSKLYIRCGVGTRDVMSQ